MEEGRLQRVRTKPSLKKVIYWDIETSDLNADWGSVFCIGYAIDEGPIRLISITDFDGWENRPWDDRNVIAAFLEVLSECGVEVTHYGTNFDIKFLQARMLANKQGVFPLLGHVDTYYIAKSKLAIKSRSLGRVADQAGVTFKKTALSPAIWKKAARADKRALDYIGKHCIADIRVLRAVYKKLSPMLRRHPVVGNYGDCHVCGSDRLQSRGYAATTKGGRQRRVQCQKCGAWGSRSEA